ncbi:hypothetical protein Stube_33540 [Streptomyces tubercidicus]|uniref:Uncharacterized protein n=1 Tax=Streptomyces tubercidicus TaxID=47759 RepID=A0A640UVE4_9ACTN|nr:hypothetical protein Stube_33540 [Streptomyces tubercidicus]
MGSTRGCQAGGGPARLLLFLLLPGCSRTVMSSTSSDRRGGARRLMWVWAGDGQDGIGQGGYALPYRLFGR